MREALYYYVNASSSYMMRNNVYKFLAQLVEEGEEDTIEEDDEILLPYVENYDEDAGNE